MSERPPPEPIVTSFNNLYWLYFGQRLNIGEMDNRYVKYPVSQGSQTINGNFDVLGMTTVSSQGITFSDGTIQTTSGGASSNPTLAQVLQQGNNAGTNDMDMNNHDILNVFDIATQTVTATGTISGLSANVTNTVSANNVTASNDVTATNTVSATTVTASGTVTGNQVTATNTVSATTVSATNVNAGGTVTANTVSTTNVNASGTVSVPTVSTTNVNASGTVSVPTVSTTNINGAGTLTIPTVSATNITASNSITAGTMTTGTLNYTTLNPPISSAPFNFGTSSQSATQYGTTGAGYIAGQKLTFGGTWNARDYVLIEIRCYMTWNGTNQTSRAMTTGLLQLKPYYMPSSGVWSSTSSSNNIQFCRNTGTGSSTAYIGTNNAVWIEVYQQAGSFDLFKLYGQGKLVQFLVQSPAVTGGFSGAFGVQYIARSASGGSVTITLGNDGTSVYLNNSLP